MKKLVVLLLGMFFLFGSVTSYATTVKTVKNETVVVHQNVLQKVISKIVHPVKSLQKPKSQLVAAILAFFLGGLGIHRFYLGYTTIGIIQLGLFLLGILGSLILVGFIFIIAVGIWALIDFIRILTGDLKPADGSDYDPAL